MLVLYWTCRGTAPIPKKVGDETLIEPSHPQEGSQLLPGSGQRAGLQGMHFADLWLDNSIPNDKPQVFGFRPGQNTLLWVDGQACSLKSPQYLPQVFKVLLPCLTVDYNIIKLRRSIVTASTYYLIHEPLESCRSTMQTKWQNSELEQPPRSTKGCQLSGLL